MPFVNGHEFTILVGDETQATAQKVDDAGLDPSVWEHGQDRLWKAIQAIDDGDPDVVDAAVLSALS